jgi:hypothetical protein
MTSIERDEMQLEALSRARDGQSFSNWPAIIRGFLEKGIPEDQILPRENVLTYHAWRALGRQVRRGEHGVKVTTFVPMTKKTGKVDPATGQEEVKPIGKRAWNATVFHLSQTDPIAS